MKNARYILFVAVTLNVASGLLGIYLLVSGELTDRQQVNAAKFDDIMVKLEVQSPEKAKELSLPLLRASHNNTQTWVAIGHRILVLLVALAIGNIILLILSLIGLRRSTQASLA